MTKWQWLRCAAILVVAGTVALRAQEISGGAGVMGAGNLSTTSYAWELDYRHRILRNHFAWSLGWLNEGHTPTHHRDGLIAQAWAVPVLDPGDFALAVGAGGYRFADTRFWPGDGYTNEHGWAPIFSLSATWYTNSPWFFRLTGNHVPERGGLSSNTLLAGVGYQLGWLRREPHRSRPMRSEHTLTVLGGRTIVNSRSSQQARAVVVEYRRWLGAHWDWTLSWLDEGDPQIMRRDGVATQLWITDEYPRSRISIALGAGPYLLFTHRDPANAPRNNDWGTAAIVTPSIAYGLGQSWQARLSWNRVFSRNNRDVDIIVVGLGYRWGQR